MDLEDSCSINLLPISHMLACQHMLDKCDRGKTIPIKLYLWAREQGIPLTTPIRDIEKELPKIIWEGVGACAFANRCVQRAGFFGQPPDQGFLATIQEYTIQLRKENEIPRGAINGQGLHASFSEIFRRWRRSSSVTFDAEKVAWSSGRKTNYGWGIIREDPSYIIYPTDEHAFENAKFVQAVLDLAHAGIPEKSVSPLFVDLFRNVCIFSEITCSKSLLAKVNDSFGYRRRFSNFLPFAYFYQQALAYIVGARLLPNLTKFGFLLGYHGSHERPYISEYLKKFGDPMYQDEPIFIVETCSEQLKLGGNIQSAALDGVKGHGYSTSIASKANYLNPFRKVQSEDGTQYLGRHVGYHVANLNNWPRPGRLLLSNTELCRLRDVPRSGFDRIAPRSPTDLYCLEPRSFTEAQGFINTIFTTMETRTRAFTELVGNNPLTKPVQDIKENIDRRWRPEFEKHVAAGFQFCEFFNEIANELNQIDAERQRFFHDESDHDVSNRYENYTSDQVCLAWDLLQKKISPNQCNWGAVEVDKVQVGRRERIICRLPPTHKSIERILSYYVKIAFAKFNLEELDGGLTNFLYGTSASIQTPPRFRPILNGVEEIVIANMDVVRCFDNVRWRNPNFDKYMRKSFDLLVEMGYSQAAQYIWSVFDGYFLYHLKRESFRFYTVTNTEPPRGSLPTGFVLSPLLWTFLVLPLCIHLRQMKKMGRIIDWELCGDDLMIVASSTISLNEKRAIIAPWLKFASEMGLEFHYFKNYKDDLVPITPWAADQLTLRDVIEFDVVDPVAAAWCKIPWPKDTLPFYHAGVAIFQNQVCVTPRLVSDPTANPKELRNARRLMISRARSCLIRFDVNTYMVPTYLLRGYQYPRLTTGEVADLVVGEQKYGKRPLLGSEELSLMLWGPRSPCSRVWFDKYKRFKDPTFGRDSANSYDLQNHFERKNHFSLRSSFSTIATGQYFINGCSMAKKFPEIDNPTQKVLVPTPAHDRNLVGKTKICSVENAPSAEELLASKAPVAVVESSGRTHIYIISDFDWANEVCRDINGKITRVHHSYTKKMLRRYIEIRVESEREERARTRAEKYSEAAIRLGQKSSVSYLRALTKWKIKDATQHLMTWFLLQDPFTSQPEISRVFSGVPVLARLPEIEELAFFLLGSEKSKGEPSRDSMFGRSEGRRVFEARKWASSGRNLQQSNSYSRTILTRIPALVFAQRTGFWSPQVLAALETIGRGEPIIPYYKGSGAVGIRGYEPKYFRHEWPRYVLRCMKSSYFGATGDEDLFNEFSIVYATYDQREKLLTRCKKQKDLLVRLADNFEYHRRQAGISSKQTVHDAFAEAASEIDQVIKVIKDSLHHRSKLSY